MKVELNLATLVVTVLVLWTAPVQSFSAINRKLLLDVTANDKVWAKHLDVGIKLNKKTLSAAAHKVLVGLGVIDAMSTGAVDSAQEPNQEQKSEQEQATGVTGEKGQEPESKNMVVAKALYIVVDVASHYRNHGVALDFALDTIASAIKCKTLMYILVQLHAIKETNDLQNDAISVQPQEVWTTLINVLDKMAVLKKSFESEFQLYQRWEVVATQDKSSQLPPDFEIFQNLVETSLTESCEMNNIDKIKEHLNLHNPEKWESVDRTMAIFSDCQKSLKEMFDDIPISTMDIKVWEIFLDKPKFEDQVGLPFKVTI